jgi:hypothetical protein
MDIRQMCVHNPDHFFPYTNPKKETQEPDEEIRELPKEILAKKGQFLGEGILYKESLLRREMLMHQCEPEWSHSTEKTPIL